MPIVVGGLRMRIRVRLVAQAPQDDAGVILVAGDHVRQHLRVIIGGRPAIGVFASFADADGGVSAITTIPSRSHRDSISS